MPLCRSLLINMLVPAAHYSHGLYLLHITHLACTCCTLLTWPVPAAHYSLGLYLLHITHLACTCRLAKQCPCTLAPATFLQSRSRGKYDNDNDNTNYYNNNNTLITSLSCVEDNVVLKITVAQMHHTIWPFG